MSNCFGFSNIVIPVTGLTYKGLWDANTNNPTLQSGVGISGDYWIVAVAGTTNLDGITDWEVNDWAIFDGTSWQKIDNSQYTPNLQQVTDAGNSTSNSIIVTNGVSESQITENEVFSGQFKLDIVPLGANDVGVTQWNDSYGVSQTRLKGDSVDLKNGIDLVARVVNKVTPNTTLTKAAYQVVKVTGAQGQRLAINLAQANNDANSVDTLGIVIETIRPNQEGFIQTVGQIEEINTTGSLQGETWLDGDVLYLSPTTPGAITKVKPTAATGHIVVLGYVEYAHAIHGKIYVKIMNGWELEELHNVYINPSTLANNDALIYNSTSQLWENKQVTENVISLSDITTNNVSTTKHGFAPKLPNDATKYLNGTGNWTAPSSFGIWGIANASGVYTYYTTLTLAMAAATSGQTIEMFADVTETGAVTITLKNGVNINGNGHTYTLDTSTNTNAFIDGGVAVVMNMSNITLVRKGAGAGAILGLSMAANRIVGFSTFLKVESNNSFGITNYGGAVFSGYINGFTITATGTNCKGIYLIRANVDTCNSIGTSHGIQIVIGTLTNCYGESNGAGYGIEIGNSGYASNCNGKSNTGYGIQNSVPIYNCTGYSAGSYGIAFLAGTLSNCVGISAASFGIFGYSENIYNCSAFSSGNLALFAQNAVLNNCTAYSSVNSAVNIYNSTKAHNSTFLTLSGATVVVTANATAGASIKNCVIINDWNNIAGHGIQANLNLSVMNSSIKVLNASANCLNSATPLTMKYANNAFEGSTTPVNPNITQGIVNTQDNQGNILI